MCRFASVCRRVQTLGTGVCAGIILTLAKPAIFSASFVYKIVPKTLISCDETEENIWYFRQNPFRSLTTA